MEYNTPESVAALAEIDPHMAEILKATPIPSGRALIDAFIATSRAFTPSPETPTEKIISIPMRDGHLNPARVHKPASKDPNTPSPLVVLIHGGGYCAGTYEQPSPTARLLARLYGATTVTISHRLAPDHPFPAAPNDVIDAVAWLGEHAASSAIGADTAAGFVVGGGSSGASLAGVAVQAWLDSAANNSTTNDEGTHNSKPQPKITGVWLQMPSFLDPGIVPEKYKQLHFAREQNKDAPVLNADSLVYLKQLYRADVRSALFSPTNSPGFLAPESIMPKTYVMVCGMDPVRDDGLVYAKMLRDSGVETRVDAYAGVPHGVGLFAAAGLEKAKRSERDGIGAFGWLLGREVGVEEVGRAVDGA